MSIAHKAPIYFVRHGETDWNVAGRLQGQIDIPINAIGQSQAARNGRRLGELLGDAARFAYVASPLLRTRETMEILRRELGLPPETYATDDRLKEIRFGLWEGKSWDELKRTERPLVRARKADPFNYVVPGGESYAILMARVVDWLKDVTAPAVVVSHGGVMRCLRGHVLGLAESEIPSLDVPQDRVMAIIDGKISLE
jgi:broad specificity phosphatase PhoE